MENWITDTTPMPLAPAPVQGLGAFEPLRRAERALLRACLSGDIARIGLQRPTAPQAQITVRASFLAFLVRGGNAQVPITARRFQIVGAWIDGSLDLGGASVPSSLWFYRCIFDRPPLLDDARIGGSVSFPGCRLPGLLAERCRIGGDLALNAGCKVRGELRLSRARIDGDLRLDRLQLPQPGGSVAERRALVADFVRIGGDVNLAGGFEADGEVRFVGARIAGNVDAVAARLVGSVGAQGGRRAALVLDGARVAGDVRFGSGFAAAGAVRLRRAGIEGDLDFTAAAFDTTGDSAWRGGQVLVLDGVRVGGALRLARLQGPLLDASLEGARVDALHDDRSTWGARIVLDGFRYRRLAPGAPTQADFRVGWLGCQPAEHLGIDWRDQPWNEAIAVLRRAGHVGSAGGVAIARERLLRRIGRIGAGLPALLRPAARALHATLGAVAGHGHQPWRVVGVLAIVWLAGTAVHGLADWHGRIAAEAPAAGTRGFDPWLYSLDVLVPGIDLGQQRRYAAAEPAALARCVGDPAAAACLSGVTRATGWLLALAGWLGLAVFVASVAGVFERRR